MNLPPKAVIEERLTNAFPNIRLREPSRPLCNLRVKSLTFSKIKYIYYYIIRLKQIRTLYQPIRSSSLQHLFEDTH